MQHLGTEDQGLKALHDFVATLTPEERLEGLSPEDVLRGFTPEQVQRLRELLQPPPETGEKKS